MKKIFLALTLLICFYASAQSEEALMTEVKISKTQRTALKAFVNDYSKYAKTLNLEKMLNFTHPGLFEISPKELIIEQLSSAFDNDFFKMEFTQMAYEGVDEAYEYQNVIYFFTKYKSSFKMAFKQAKQQTNDDFEAYMKYLVELYTIQFEGDKVERNNNIISISGIRRLLVVKDATLDGLKMLEVKPGMNMIYKRFIPEDVVNALGNP